MAVFVYKDGVKELIDPLALDGALAAGWTVDEKPKKRTRGPNKPKTTAANFAAELEPKTDGTSED